MESHIINIVRFATCITIFVVCIILMFKADDNNLMRRLSAAFGVIFIFFNKRIGIMVYLFIGSAIETFIATAGVGFVLVLVVSDNVITSFSRFSLACTLSCGRC